MRSVIISALLFAVLLSCVLANAIFIDSTSQRLCEISEKLRHEDTREATLSELEDFWDSRRDFVGLSVSNMILDNADDIIIRLRASADAKNTSDFEQNRLLLADVAEKISRGERLNIGTIF